MAKKQAGREEKKRPNWSQAWERVCCTGPFSFFAKCVSVRCGSSYPIGRDDWAYVTSEGEIYLNPRKEATVGEWEYIITHCMLHLGFGHFRPDGDGLWNNACDIVVSNFLREAHIGSIPPNFEQAPPCDGRSEEQVELWLREHGAAHGFSTMRDRPDMVWTKESRTDFPKRFAEALQNQLRYSLYELKETDGLERQTWTPYREAREWFISSYPLLGSVAASFRIVDDESIVSRMNIPVAAVCPELKEIYIRPYTRLDAEEWKFVLAHEFLHAALRHDLRCEGRDPNLWNVACDYAVNLWLREMNVGMMPDFCLYDEAFKGLSAEGIYDLLLADVRRYSGKAVGDILYGTPGFWESVEGAELDAFYRAALTRGLEYAQASGRGYLPAGLVEEIYAQARPPIRWDVELAKWFDENFSVPEKHRSYSRLSRRQSSTPDIPRPAWQLEEVPEGQRIFGVVLDTSGSMDRGLLAAALGSIASYSEARAVNHVRVVFCDAAPYDQGVMHPQEIAGAVQVKGRGGTKLQPGIDLLEHDPKFPKDAPLLIITDGDCDKLTLYGREHAYLIPHGSRLPFIPKGKVFRLR